MTTGSKEERVSLLEQARLGIVHLKLEESADLWAAVGRAAQISSTSLAVGRVGVWFLSADRLTLERLVLHDATSGSSGQGLSSLPLERWPRYRDAILSRRVVAVDDVASDPRTSELGEYLRAHDIKSMLDAPVFLGGEVWGVLCHEHVGVARAWTPREVDFAVSVADMLSVLLEQSVRLASERRGRKDDAVAAQSRRVEAVATAASAIGHDVNTVLQAIASSAERASRAEGAERNEAVATILTNCARGARFVEQLRDLVGERPLLGAGVDISVVVDALRPTLHALVGPAHQVTITLEPGAHVPATRADIERVVLNLVVNARDAMPDGGMIELSVVGGTSVVLAVRDHGVGIALPAVEHVFEPYFTTKPGRHTGLGLFAVHTIAVRTGGTVAVTSTVGSGTTILVTWPAPP